MKERLDRLRQERIELLEAGAETASPKLLRGLERDIQETEAMLREYESMKEQGKN
jgi:hypothetical protein